MYLADFIGTSAPASAAQVLADERAVQTSTAKDWSFTTSWDKNPNARLWDPTTAVVPAANSYSVALATNLSLAFTAALQANLYSLAIVFDVEFRGSQ